MAKKFNRKKWASTAIRYKGRFVTKAFYENIQMLANANGLDYTDREVIQSYYLQNERMFSDMYQNSVLTSHEMSSGNIIKNIKMHSGRVLVNGVAQKPNDAIYNLLMLETFLRSHLEVGGFAIKMQTNYKGDLMLTIPKYSESFFEDMDEEDILEELNEQGIEAYAIYNGMDIKAEIENAENKKEAERIERNYNRREQGLKKAKKMLKDARKSRTKGKRS